MAEEKKVEPVSAAWNLYSVAPEDGPCLYEINVPLSSEMFKQKPKDVKKTKLSDMIGTKFIVKRGATDREKEETSLTEDITSEHFDNVHFIGLFFANGKTAPCKLMLKHLKNFYIDINL